MVVLGWIHRLTLKKRGVTELSNCRYIEINDQGLVILRDGKTSTLEVIGARRLFLSCTCPVLSTCPSRILRALDAYVVSSHNPHTSSISRGFLQVDTVVICAGQESQRDLLLPTWGHMKTKVFLIGGAEFAGELDAKRAIDQGTRLVSTGIIS